MRPELHDGERQLDITKCLSPGGNQGCEKFALVLRPVLGLPVFALMPNDAADAHRR